MAQPDHTKDYLWTISSHENLQQMTNNQNPQELRFAFTQNIIFKTELLCLLCANTLNENLFLKLIVIWMNVQGYFET